jgi:FkbM family methyltransferase
MLISVSELQRFWSVKARTVLHVGAHNAEEAAEYERAGWLPVLWVEALPDKVLELRRRFADSTKHRVYGALVWDSDNKAMTLRRTNNGQSSSVLPFGSHQAHYPLIEVVDSIPLRSSRLDTLLKDVNEACDFINLDIQGAELAALRGLGGRLKDARWIYVEVNTEEVYEGIPHIHELDRFLSQAGFQRADLQMTSQGWGDALYIRTDICPRLRGLRRTFRRIARRLRAFA